MKTLLTVADIEYLLTQQAKLDKDIREKFDITQGVWCLNMRQEHELALNVELHEFFNSAYRSWKYWKTKEMDYEDILDEAIDVIHFVMLDLNKKVIDTHDFSKNLIEYLKICKVLETPREVKDLMWRMTTENINSREVLAGVLRILDYYNFTSKDIIDQYNVKNKINFERLQGNY